MTMGELYVSMPAFPASAAPPPPPPSRSAAAGTPSSHAHQPHIAPHTLQQLPPPPPRHPSSSSTTENSRRSRIRKQVFLDGHGLLDEDLYRLDRLGIASLLQRNLTLSEGKRIHAHLTRCGLLRDTYLGNLLIRMYRRYDNLEDARSVFDAIGRRDVVSWTAMIDAYTKHGNCEEAFRLFHEMQLQGVKPDKITFICILGACIEPTLLPEVWMMRARCSTTCKTGTLFPGML